MTRDDLINTVDKKISKERALGKNRDKITSGSQILQELLGWDNAVKQERKKGTERERDR